MKHRFAAFAAVSALALTLTVAPASASPVIHLTVPATDPDIGQIVCNSNTYTFTSGNFFFVFRDSSIAAHMTANRVQAIGTDKIPYKVVGTEKYSDPWLLVSKLLFIGPNGDIMDSVNITGHLSPNGSYHWFDIGTCGF